MKRIFLFSFALTLLSALLTYAQQQRQLIQDNSNSSSNRRIALVIGNSSYEIAPLKNPVNDAQDIAQALRELGFEIIYKENLNQTDMKRVIRTFGEKLRAGSDVSLFYYAGHGVQVKGLNYLVPVDAKVESEAEVEYECVDAGFVLAQMESVGNHMNIVILDACRNNPFARSFRSASRGLAQMDAPSGTLIAYATAPGSVASDGSARNGLYTQELLKFIRTPNLSIEEVFKQVRISVRNLTQGKQTPWESSSLTGDFFFSGKGRKDVESLPSTNTSSVLNLEGTIWEGQIVETRTPIKLEFMNGGKVLFTSRFGANKVGAWVRKGDFVSLSFDHFRVLGASAEDVEFAGSIKGNIIEGFVRFDSKGGIGSGVMEYNWHAILKAK